MSTATPPTAKPCPVCGRPPETTFRPFCSKRCADVDLSRWLGGVYRIETPEPVSPGPEADESDGL